MKIFEKMNELKNLLGQEEYYKGMQAEATSKFNAAKSIVFSELGNLKRQHNDRIKNLVSQINAISAELAVGEMANRGKLAELQAELIVIQKIEIDAVSAMPKLADPVCQMEAAFVEIAAVDRAFQLWQYSIKKTLSELDLEFNRLKEKLVKHTHVFINNNYDGRSYLTDCIGEIYPLNPHDITANVSWVKDETARTIAYRFRSKIDEAADKIIANA